MNQARPEKYHPLHYNRLKCGCNFNSLSLVKIKHASEQAFIELKILLVKSSVQPVTTPQIDNPGCFKCHRKVCDACQNFLLPYRRIISVATGKRYKIRPDTYFCILQKWCLGGWFGKLNQKVRVVECDSKLGDSE